MSYDITACPICNEYYATIQGACPRCHDTTQRTTRKTPKKREFAPLQATVQFFVAGQPQPKQRPRTTRTRSGKYRTYTPQKTIDYERHVAQVASMHIRKPLQDDVYIVLEFRRKGKIYADVDNMIKSVLDGLQDVAFVNDSQVTRIYASVDYITDGEGVAVTICTELNEFAKTIIKCLTM